jgi:hypothetical protein
VAELVLRHDFTEEVAMHQMPRVSPCPFPSTDEDGEDVMELVRRHSFTGGLTHHEDRALAVMAVVLAEQPGHTLTTSTLNGLARKRDPGLRSLKGKLGRLLDACPVFVLDPEDPNSVRLDVEALQRSAGVGQAASGGPEDGGNAAGDAAEVAKWSLVTARWSQRHSGPCHGIQRGTQVAFMLMRALFIRVPPRLASRPGHG